MVLCIITINSLRKNDVARQNLMERDCDPRAGNKHHLTSDYLVYLKQSLMDLCLRENLHQVDLLIKAEQKVTEKEYHARRNGQKKLEERNRQMISEGIIQRTTVFQTQKEYLRIFIDEAAASAHDLKEFEQILPEKFNIKFKISGSGSAISSLTKKSRLPEEALRHTMKEITLWD